MQSKYSSRGRSNWVIHDHKTGKIMTQYSIYYYPKTDVYRVRKTPRTKHLSRFHKGERKCEDSGLKIYDEKKKQFIEHFEINWCPRSEKLRVRFNTKRFNKKDFQKGTGREDRKVEIRKRLKKSSGVKNTRIRKRHTKGRRRHKS